MRSTWRLLVDEAGFEMSSEDSESVERTFQALGDVLAYTRECGEQALKWSGIWYIESVSGRSLYDWLFADSEVDRDVRSRLSVALDRVNDWDDDPENSPLSLEVTCGTVGLQLAPSIALAASAVLCGREAACLTTDQAARSGREEVRCADLPLVALQFIASRGDGLEYWRRVILSEARNAVHLQQWGPLAFPDLTMAEGIWGQVSNFEGSFQDNLPLLVRDLAGLNDFASLIWRDHVEPATIQAHMSSKAKIECSRDSSNTHRNKSAMAQRRVSFGSKTVMCEWHTKLEPHRNRIHFAVEGGHVYVGLFTRHLDT